MRAFTRLLSHFWKDDAGATAIEYGLIAAIVCIGIIAALGGLRDGLNNIFNNVSTPLSK
jgi:pilus assembly protein Flp/PilA